MECPAGASTVSSLCWAANAASARRTRGVPQETNPRKVKPRTRNTRMGALCENKDARGGWIEAVSALWTGGFCAARSISPGGWVAAASEGAGGPAGGTEFGFSSIVVLAKAHFTLRVRSVRRYRPIVPVTRKRQFVAK